MTRDVTRLLRDQGWRLARSGPAGLLLGSLLFVSACPGPVKPPTSLKEAKPVDPWAKADLIKPPKPAAAAALKLPPVNRFTLNNGLAVLTLRDDQLPLINVRLTLPVGSIDDPADRVGIADFTAMMLRQGAGGMSAEHIAQTVDRAGARLSVSPGYEVTTISCGAQARDLGLCLKMVAALVAQPSFPQEEMSEISSSLEAQVRSDRDDPGMLVAKHFYNQLYGDDHPAGRPLTLGSIAAIKRADLQRFYKTFYQPKGAVLAISGDVDPATLKRLATRAFACWRHGTRPPRTISPLAAPAPGLRVLLVDKPDLTQAFFMLGHAGVAMRDPDRDALRLVNYTLGGGGFSSRLMKVVRSKGGKTYGISSAFYAHEVDGLFRVRSSTRNAELWRTMALVKGELDRIRRVPPTAAEIAAAKGKLAGGFAIRFKTGSQLAAALALAQVRGLGDTYVSELPLRIDRLDEATVAAAARTHVKPSAMVLAIVGKGSVVAPLLDKAGVRYQKIDYLAPISARARAREKMAATISPAEQKAGAELLAEAIKAAGGERAVRKLKALKLSGTLTRQTRHGQMVSTYAAEMLPPTHLRLSFVLAGAAAAGRPAMKMEQVLAGERGFMVVNGKKQPLPPRTLGALKRSLWRHPAFVLKNALAKGVRLRPSTDPQIDAKTQRGLEIFPVAGRPLTLVLDNETYRLVGLRDKGRSGEVNISTLSGHQRDETLGLWLPRKQVAQGGKLVLEVKRIEINPRLDKQSITR